MVWRTIALAPLMVVLLRPAVLSQSAERMGPLKVHPTNKRYFAAPSGAPVYLTGSHTWENFQDIGPAGEAPFDYLDYLKVLKAWNHNFIRLWMWEHAWSKGPVGGEAFVSPMPYVRPGPGLASGPGGAPIDEGIPRRTRSDRGPREGTPGGRDRARAPPPAPRPGPRLRGAANLAGGPYERGRS